MTDETERKLEATPPIARPSDAVKRDCVIAGLPKEIHGQAFAVAHENDVRPSDPSLIAALPNETLEAYKARVAAIQENAFGFTGELTAGDIGKKLGKQASDQPLIASAVSPDVPTAESMPEGVQATSTSEQLPNIAQELEYNYDGRLPTLLPGLEVGQALNAADATVTATEVSLRKAALAAERQWNPFRGEIVAKINEVPVAAWYQAYKAFPQFKEAHLTEKQTVDLMQAIVRNELYNYDRPDQIDDEQALGACRKTPKSIDA